MTETELKKQVDRGELKRFYFLYGPEKYMLQRHAERIMSKAGAAVFEDFNLQKFDGREASVEAISVAVTALPFMAERKCVAVSDFDVESRNAADMEKFNQLLADLPETTVLLFYYPGLEFDPKRAAKWKKIIALAEKQGESVCFERRSEADLEKLLCTAAAKRFCDLSRQNAGKIIRSCGNDLQTLFNELEKLCAFTGEGEITSATIEKLVTKNLESTVFLLAKAVVAGDPQKAYSILDLLFSQNEEPVAILAVLSSSYVDMYRAAASIRSGLAVTEAAKHFDYKGKEFRLRNAERDSRGVSLPVLRRSLDVLLKADLALKGARGDRRITLERYIAELLLLAKGGELA